MFSTQCGILGEVTFPIVTIPLSGKRDVGRTQHVSCLHFMHERTRYCDSATENNSGLFLMALAMNALKCAPIKRTGDGESQKCTAWHEYSENLTVVNNRSVGHEKVYFLRNSIFCTFVSTLDISSYQRQLVLQTKFAKTQQNMRLELFFYNLPTM